MGAAETSELATVVGARDGETATARLHRPSKANAVNRQMLTDLITLCDWPDEREDIHFLVLTNEARSSPPATTCSSCTPRCPTRPAGGATHATSSSRPRR